MECLDSQQEGDSYLRITGLSSLPQGPGHVLEQLISSRVARSSRWRGGILRSMYLLMLRSSSNPEEKKDSVEELRVGLRNETRVLVMLGEVEGR